MSSQQQVGATSLLSDIDKEIAAVLLKKQESSRIITEAMNTVREQDILQKGFDKEIIELNEKAYALSGQLKESIADAIERDPVEFMRNITGRANFPPIGPDKSVVGVKSDDGNLFSEEMLNTFFIHLDPYNTSLSVRAHNCIKAANLHFLLQLAILTSGDGLLGKFKNMGRKSIAEFQELLRMNNLNFEMVLNDAQKEQISLYIANKYDNLLMGFNDRPERKESAAKFLDSWLLPKSSISSFTSDQLNFLITPVSELELSARSLNSLKAGSIDFPLFLVILKSEEIYKLRNLGKISVQEIREKLLDNGFNFDTVFNEQQLREISRFIEDNNWSKAHFEKFLLWHKELA